MAIERGALAGRTAVVTGASRGIGRAVARALVEAGARVVMVARSEADLARAADAVGGEGVAADVSTQEGVQLLADHLAGDAAVPEIIINSAGSFSLGPLAQAEAADFDRQVASNLRSPFLVIRRFLPGMLQRGSGHIVNIGSVAGRLAMPGNAIYSATKFGLRGMHEVLEQELRGTGVRATMVEPSATDTPLWDALDPDSRDDLPGRGQMLRPEEVAASVLFALSQPEGVEVGWIAVRPARS